MSGWNSQWLHNIDEGDKTPLALLAYTYNLSVTRELQFKMGHFQKKHRNVYEKCR